MADEVTVEPGDVERAGREFWKISDDLAKLRVDSTMSDGATAMRGGDMGRGLARYAHEQQDIVNGISEELDALGTQVKRAAEAYRRAEDRSAERFRALGVNE
ncbi:hypothetical protein GOARA_052_00010 [Gordonia araii NBRC 100433]|uniref:ESX-1 secretion-associated protein n=1 Tax=Gordonia araii NBRC 100433 TaxID=1073574 RepID=G7H2M7_9ACTN|nr:type VII secretion target [Gordonia araii]NNG98572.1 hypothetical protein [Gordonia araii NBRC 100433]GAB10102.1 hypothetical protein GOARA_052_00010 [Gordonia araii NBRC 100433]